MLKGWGVAFGGPLIQIKDLFVGSCVASTGCTNALINISPYLRIQKVQVPTCFHNERYVAWRVYKTPSIWTCTSSLNILCLLPTSNVTFFFSSCRTFFWCVSNGIKSVLLLCRSSLFILPLPFLYVSTPQVGPTIAYFSSIGLQVYCPKRQ